MERERVIVDERRAGAALPACLFAWLVPGAGHLYLGRIGKGLVFLRAIGALFVLGVVMDAGFQMPLGFDDPLAFLHSLAQMALGGPSFPARPLRLQAGKVSSWT